jgi:hypothetical protein
MKCIIYAAIGGEYDQLKEPPAQDVPCDFVCITDAAWPDQISLWRIIKIPPQNEVHPRMRAKRFKLISHSVLPRGKLRFGGEATYDPSIWVDECLQIKSARFARDVVGAIKAPARPCSDTPIMIVSMNEARACAALPYSIGRPCVGRRATNSRSLTS